MLRSASRAARGGALATVAVVSALFAWTAPPVAALSDGRAYEMVSPPDKNGGDVVADTQRSRAATDGDAITFDSLASFAGALGTGVANDYLSVRSPNPDPGTNGWTTHGLLPRMRPVSAIGLLAHVDPQYVGEFSPDLDRGVLATWGSLDGNANVDGVANLSIGDGLRTPGTAAFSLLSSCPLCDSTATPLPDFPPLGQASNLKATLAGASPDLGHVVFESAEQLTADTPPQPGSCNMQVPGKRCREHVYEWDDGSLSLAGRVPVLPATECSDSGGGPACTPADVSIAGEGTGAGRSSSSNRTPHVVTVGADGHVRVLFTQPTDANNNTSDDLGNSTSVNAAFGGRIFMRVDGTSTVQLNASERTDCADSGPCTGAPAPDTYAPAQLLDASPDGTRVFFMDAEALTNDAPVDGQSKLYMYDTTKPAGAPSHLTYLETGVETGNEGNVVGTIGVSNDGRYVYFVDDSPLVNGQPALVGTLGIYLWHDGPISYVGQVTGGALGEDISAGTVSWVNTQDQARATPDGRHLLFSTIIGDGNLGYDHGVCASSIGLGCRELYVYDADSGQLSCASCNPSGAAATAMAADSVVANNGAAATSWHLNHAISDDGTRVFFSTGEALVPEDVNGRQDAYEWTAAGTNGCPASGIPTVDNGLTKGCLALLSSGADTSDSYFMDASPNGSDAFFVTREQLVGWDTDQAYDLYDARVGGGFPNPVPAPSCSADTCQGSPSGAPAQNPLATTLFQGAGNLGEKLRAHVVPRPRPVKCKRGFVRKRVRGKVKCVKQPKKKSHASRAAVRSKRAQKTNRRAS